MRHMAIPNYFPPPPHTFFFLQTSNGPTATAQVFLFFFFIFCLALPRAQSNFRRVMLSRERRGGGSKCASAAFDPPTYGVAKAEVAVGGGEVFAAKEAIVRGKGRRVSRTQDLVARLAHDAAALLGMSPPQHEDHAAALLVDVLHHRAREVRPAARRVGIGLPSAHREGCVEQKHTLDRPAREVAGTCGHGRRRHRGRRRIRLGEGGCQFARMFGRLPDGRLGVCPRENETRQQRRGLLGRTHSRGLASQVGRHFLHDVDEAGWLRGVALDGERQAMRLSGAVVGILFFFSKKKKVKRKRI
jgi:hypothetical protein